MGSSTGSATGADRAGTLEGVTPLEPTSAAPDIPGVDLGSPRALWFHKVTCPVCQLAAPVAQRLADAHADRVVGVGQDPAPELAGFSREFGTSFPVVADEAPYELSRAYGVRIVPTLVLVEDGRIADVVESWDRDGYNRVSARLAEMTGSPYVEISAEGDGLPAFRPG